MPEGTIIKLTDKGFGFIRSTSGEKEYFFHRNDVAKGSSFQTMKEGQKVNFDLRPSQKKPGQQDAFNVKSREDIASKLTASVSGEAHQNHGVLMPTTNTSLLPYGFVPVNTELAITDTPVWHDGGGTSEELLSGEILCTLEALTPLLPGNARYPAIRKKEGEENSMAEADLAKLQAWGFANAKPGKQIAEPLRLADGRVVIAGSALKGMIRHSLGALLSAPMERVAERHYTYRPNFGHGGKESRLECRPAIVKKISDDEIEVDVLPKPRSAIFLHRNGPVSFSSYKAGTRLEGKYNDLAFGVWVSRYNKDLRRKEEVFTEDSNRLTDKKGSSVTLDHFLYSA